MRSFGHVVDALRIENVITGGSKEISTARDVATMPTGSPSIIAHRAPTDAIYRRNTSLEPADADAGAGASAWIPKPNSDSISII
ncbi:hypothetical protein ACFVKB_38945 [Rhodococcus sp. NPDC127530]|uniref:hypothetical protein n=1 Tax=unclassified Rhodococcus (in: high G+C Gram-positive bacteria) TaxID=192944 RepID=UPI003642AADF